MTTDVDNSSSQGNSSWNAGGGRNTEDKVFLLSYAETEKYFNSDNDRICKTSAYMNTQRTNANEGGNCGWWLRSPGFFINRAAIVSSDGSLGSFNSVDGKDAVRPVLWVNLESDIF